MKIKEVVSRALCVQWLLLLCVGSGGVYLAFQAAGRHRPLAIALPSRESESDNIILEMGAPPRLRPLVRRMFSADSEEAVMVSGLLQEHPSLPPNVSLCCHLLHLYGLKSFRHPVFASGAEIVSILTDQKRAKAYFGEPIIFRTRDGIRYNDDTLTHNGVAGENHRDICLATFAELGLPLSMPVTTEDGSFTLADLLRDSVENFDIKQHELPWTVIAYATYLRQRQWSNRYGESFTFDDLAGALLKSPLEHASCGGVHLLYAMTVLLRAKASAAYLTASVRHDLSQCLHKWSIAASQSQATDGSWDLHWYVASRERSPGALNPSSRSRADALLVTGHLLEWLELLPQEIQPPPETYQKAARWLCRSLAGTSVRSLTEFCPVVHAQLAVRALIDGVGS